MFNFSVWVNSLTNHESYTSPVCAAPAPEVEAKGGPGQILVGHQDMASAGARAYNGSGGRAPSGVQGLIVQYFAVFVIVRSKPGKTGLFLVKVFSVDSCTSVHTIWKTFLGHLRFCLKSKMAATNPIWPPKCIKSFFFRSTFVDFWTFFELVIMYNVQDKWISHKE